MGPAVLLKQLMSNLCHNTLWNYAVFWKIKQKNNMLLTWDDGYCENLKSAVSMEEPNHFCTAASRNISFGCKKDGHNEFFTGFSLEQAVANMSNHLYVFGEGIIGNVAFTGEHLWIIADLTFLSEYPEEWCLQIASGIKTILLVPIPQGVVQLGCLEVIAENITTVAYIKHLFASLEDTNGLRSHPILGENINPFLTTPISCSTTVAYIKHLFASLEDTNGFRSHPILGEHINPFLTTPISCSAFSITTTGLPFQPSAHPLTKKHKMVFDTEPVTKKEQSNSDDHISPIVIQESVPSSRTDVQHILGTNLELPLDEISYNSMHSIFSVVPSHDLDSFLGSDKSFLKECQSSSFSPDNILIAPSQYGDFDHMLFTQQASFLNSCETELECGQYDARSFMDEVGWPFVNESLDIIDHEQNSCVLNLPADSVLQAPQMPFLHETTDNQMWNSSLSCDQKSSSPDTCEIDEICHKNLPFVDFNDLSFVEREEKLVLDVVESVTHYSSDEKTQNFLRFVRSSSNLSGEVVGSCLTQNKSEIGALETDLLGSNNCLDSRVAVANEAFIRSPTRSPSESGSLVINEEKNRAPRHGSVAIKKSFHVGKKKSKAGDTHKPRPRDRQLIQDRVMELRELVPQGEKCSIDALLERTIKHMLFLKGLSSQAEKLKNCAHPKGSNENRSSAGQLNLNGATWAYELGSKPEVCPILVENLEQQGHMLVEMLCTEYGDFLEIAQVIRHSELVILKGGMECRHDKLWAHFIVEASRGFDRMDILWPLMRLMQRGGGPITSVL